jgi:Ni,Fe-hydrogenase III small subunit
MFKILKTWIRNGCLTSDTFSLDLLDSKDLYLPRIQKIDHQTQKALSRSLLIRHLDAGSCNAEEAEMLALSGPYYDITRFGLDFTASPRHADILTISGPLTRHLVIAMTRTYHAMPDPKIVVAIGNGACTGSPYESNYACIGRVDQFLPVDLYIPGDPPTPRKILEGLLYCKLILSQNKPKTCEDK